MSDDENSHACILGAFIIIIVMFLGIMVGRTLAKELTLFAVVSPHYEVKVIDDTLYVETNMHVVINSKQIR
jgi:hypothetical protein